MALTVVPVARIKNQPQRYGQMNVRIVDVQFPNPYVAGGIALNAADVGFNKIYGAALIGFADGAADGTVTSIALDVETTETAPKLIAYDGGTEVAAIDLSGIKVRLEVRGI